MSIRNSFRHTIYASYLGYITQAIINNFVPLLLLTFHTTWHISLSQLATLVSVNFGIQLTVDLASARFVDRIGYRPCIVFAHIMAGAGLIALGILPYLLPNAFVGILIAILLYAVGGGLTEVLISPIVEACPTDHKEAAMSLLHSFYCWGHVFVILASTLFFVLAGVENWRYLSFLWALIPLGNAVYFSLVPIRQLNQDTPEDAMKPGRLFTRPAFWLFMMLMLCAGASEQAMSQWASAFAEAGLGVSKTVGDLAGPCLFAALMGLARLLSSRLSRKYALSRLMMICCGLCMVSYLVASLSPWPVLSLLGCGLCGFSVGIMWPGTFSMAAVGCRGGGTAMFALLALAGDFGCMAGPGFVGMMTDLSADNSLRAGLLPAIVFPLLLFIGLIVCVRMMKASTDKSPSPENETTIENAGDGTDPGTRSV